MRVETLCLFLFQAFTELRTMQFIQTRLKFIVGFMGVIILLATSIVYSKFGFGILEDNFVARLYTDYASVTHFLAFYALLNLYIYLMIYAYRYVVCTKPHQHIYKTKKLLNDICSPCGHKEGGSLPLGDMGDSDEEVKGHILCFKAYSFIKSSFNSNISVKLSK